MAAREGRNRTKASEWKGARGKETISSTMRAPMAAWETPMAFRTSPLRKSRRTTGFRSSLLPRSARGRRAKRQTPPRGAVEEVLLKAAASGAGGERRERRPHCREGDLGRPHTPRVLRDGGVRHSCGATPARPLAGTLPTGQNRGVARRRESHFAGRLREAPKRV